MEITYIILTLWLSNRILPNIFKIFIHTLTLPGSENRICNSELNNCSFLAKNRSCLMSISDVERKSLVFSSSLDKIAFTLLISKFSVTNCAFNELFLVVATRRSNERCTSSRSMSDNLAKSGRVGFKLKLVFL